MGVEDVAALIAWVCRVDHPVKAGDPPLTAITVHRGAWAYCSQGLFEECVWEATEPVSVEELKLRFVRRPSETEAEEQLSPGAA